MTSPYLDKPLRTYEEALSEVQRRRAARVCERPADNVGNAPTTDPGDADDSNGSAGGSDREPR